MCSLQTQSVRLMGLQKRVYGAGWIKTGGE
jgi:hypothetical protein